MIDRGEKRPVWNDDDEDEIEVNLNSNNITKKFKSGDSDKISGRQLEEKLRKQVYLDLRFKTCCNQTNIRLFLV